LLNGLFSNVERSAGGTDQQIKEVLDFAAFAARSLPTPSDCLNKCKSARNRGTLKPLAAFFRALPSRGVLRFIGKKQTISIGLEG
jgi:hypothetical protein